MLNIHRLLLHRLIASWLLISLAIGGVVSYIGIEKIDEQLVGIVSAESAKMDAARLAIINSSVSDPGALAHLTDGFVQDNFVVVEIYNRHGAKVLERVNPRFETIEQHLKQYTHVFPRDGSFNYDRFKVDGQSVLQALVPIKDQTGAVAGFLEGVFIIDPETLVRLAEALGLRKDEIRKLIAGAFLHDVGKIGVSDSILLKPAKLTDEEFAAMKTHVTLGVDILTKSNWLQSARDVVEFHHEKFNGKGYVRGLKGEGIPINARIFAIVDVFDALTSKRPYKDPLPFAEAMAILHGDSGSHFDPRLIAAFEGIAEPLHREINGATDEQVEKKLQALIERIFFTDQTT